MNTNDTQQEHIYNEHIQEIFPLFDKIKKEDDPIYNARVDFNAVKFSTEHANWNWDEEENKDKAYGVILQECDKTKKAGQELESEVKERLKEYVDDVAGVSIYGNHASITLGDNKKEFKISEFLNSDFCEKNEISGFSTLHSDGKSGMHGFVAEEKGKKIRHYVVTDGSYEMTLKWYAEGKECKIKIKIDANGVDLVKGDDFSLERLEANRDVKIGGLFLHEIKFREKGQGKANEMQKDSQSSEAFIKSNSRDIEQEVEKPLIGSLFSHPPQQEVRSQTTRLQSNDENDSGYGSQGKNPQNKKTPPQVPTRTSSLKKGVFDEQGSGSQKPDDLRGSEQTPNNQQKGEHQPTTVSSGNDYGFPSSDPSDFTKSVSHNQDNRQEDERYDNPTFGHAVPGSQKPDKSEQIPNNQPKGATTVSRSDSGNDLGYGSQGKNPQNKKTPPQVPTRTSSLPPEKDVFNEQGRSKLGSQKPDDLRENEQTPNNQQKGEHQSTTVSSGNDYGFPSSDPSDFTKSVSHNQDNMQKDERYDNLTFATFGHAVPGSQKPDKSEQIPNDQPKGTTSDSSDSSTFTKSVSHNQDNRQEDERYDNPTFGHVVPGSQKPDKSEQIPNNQQQPKTQQQEGNSKGDLLQDIRNFKKNNLRHFDVDDREASIAGSRKNNPSPLETLKDRIPYSPSPDIHNSGNQDASDAEWKESEQPLSATAFNNKGDSGYSSQIHVQPQVDPEQPKRSLENIEQSDQTPPENLLKEIRDRSQQDNRGLRQVDPTDKLSQDKEDGLQKDNLADVKTVEGPTVNVSASTPNSISDSGYISPTSSDSKPRTDLKQVGRKLEEHIRQSNLTLFEELKNTLGQENLGLKPADQSQISEETKKRLREDGLLKDSSTDVKTNDSGYSSPTHANHEQSQVNPEQLKKSLENIEPKEIGDTSELKEALEALEKLDKGLREPAQQATKENIPKDSFSENVLEKIGEGKQYDPIRKWLEKTVAERENADTSPTVDKNSELYKLLEKDKIQLEVGIIKEERKDTLTEHTDGYDRNRIALANRNKRPLDWAKQVAESQQEKDTKKGISI